MPRIILISVLALCFAPPVIAQENDWAAGIGWITDCKRDAMSDKVICHAAKYDSSVFIFYGPAKTPQAVCILGHDFPGRVGTIRIDKNKPMTTSKEGCIDAARVLPQMLKGQAIVTRKYEWPYDYPKDSEGSLAGLRDAMVKVDFLRKHPQ